MVLRDWSQLGRIIPRISLFCRASGRGPSCRFLCSDLPGFEVSFQPCRFPATGVDQRAEISLRGLPVGDSKDLHEVLVFDVLSSLANSCKTCWIFQTCAPGIQLRALESERVRSIWLLRSWPRGQLHGSPRHILQTWTTGPLEYCWSLLCSLPLLISDIFGLY